MLQDISNISAEEFRIFLQSHFDDTTILNAFNLSSKDCILESMVTFDRDDLLKVAISNYSVLETVLSTTNSKSYAVLHLIVLSGSIRLLQLLKPFFSDQSSLRDKQTKWGETALHLASGTGNEALVQLLIEIGVDESSKDNWGRTAADIAQETGHMNLFKLTKYRLNSSFLTPKSTDIHDSDPQRSQQPRQIISQEFMKALNNRQPTNAPVLVKSIFSENLEAIRQSDESLHVNQIKPAIIRSKLPALSKMLEYPGDPVRLADLMDCNSPNFNTYDINGKDMFGLAAIHKVSSWNKVDLLDLLLSHPDIDVNLIASGSNGGFSALHFAVENNAQLCYERLLKDPRIQINLLDQKGRTPQQLIEDLANRNVSCGKNG
jgi:ankyrin repeat protein